MPFWQVCATLVQEAPSWSLQHNLHLEHCGWLVEIIKRSDDAKGFVVLPRRWVVERTFGWLYRFRRLSKDYEVLPETSEAWIYAAMVRIMLQRLARDPAVYL